MNRRAFSTVILLSLILLVLSGCRGNEANTIISNTRVISGNTTINNITNNITTINNFTTTNNYTTQLANQSINCSSSSSYFWNLSIVNNQLQGQCDPDSTGGSDGNNYPTSIAFSNPDNYTLTLSRSGLSDLTASLDLSYKANRSELSAYNDTAAIGLKLDAADQRYNDTAAISLKLNITDQRYNDTAAINLKLNQTWQTNTSICDKVTQVNWTNGVLSAACGTDQTGSATQTVYNYAAYIQNNTWFDGAHYHGNLGNASQSSNLLMAYPVMYGKSTQIKALGFAQGTNVNGGGCTVGIYNSTNTNVPSTLIINTSYISTTNLTTLGVRNKTVTYTIQPGLYWHASICNNTGNRWRLAMNMILPVMGFRSEAIGGTYFTHYQNATSTNQVLPSSFPISTATKTANGNPTAVFALIDIT